MSPPDQPVPVRTASLARRRAVRALRRGRTAGGRRSVAGPVTGLRRALVGPLTGLRLKLGALAGLTGALALAGAPGWTVVVLAGTCLGVPLAVGLRDGGPTLRTLLLGRADRLGTARNTREPHDPGG